MWFYLRNCIHYTILVSSMQLKMGKHVSFKLNKHHTFTQILEKKIQLYLFICEKERYYFLKMVRPLGSMSIFYDSWSLDNLLLISLSKSIIFDQSELTRCRDDLETILNFNQPNDYPVSTGQVCTCWLLGHRFKHRNKILWVHLSSLYPTWCWSLVHWVLQNLTTPLQVYKTGEEGLRNGLGGIIVHFIGISFNRHLFAVNLLEHPVEIFVGLTA